MPAFFGRGDLVSVSVAVADEIAVFVAGVGKVTSELGRVKSKAAGLQVQAMVGLEVNFQPRQVLQ